MQQEVQQRLERWKGWCVVCHSAGRPSYHSISRCSEPSSQPAEAERKRVQRSIKFSPDVGCYKCAVPRVICDGWTADGQSRSGSESCQFFGISIGVVYGVKDGYPGIWGRWVDMIRRRGETVRSEVEIEQFLARAIGKGGSDDSELLQAFMWMTRRMEDGG
jgi:hypothetical protein